jgi:hypothetical protein
MSPKGKYHPHHGHMADNTALCDWAGELQDKLHIVYKHFEHYLGVWTSIIVIYRLLYELLLLLYISVMFNEICAWMWFELNF